MQHVCPFCDKTFKNAKCVSEHRIRIHGVKVRKKGDFRCLETDCNFVCGARQVLAQHLNMEHRIKQETSTLRFSQMKDFYSWKQKEEMLSCSHFILGSGANETATAKIYYYSCNRSGQYVASCEKNSRKRALKTQGSIKTDVKCTAYMKVSEVCDSKKVTVIYSSGHYGHQKTVAHVPMADSARLELAGKLKAGVNPSRILHDCHKTNVGNSSDSICERNMLIGKKDLYNIKKQFNISGVSRHKDDIVSVSMRIQELKNAGNTDIVFYKPGGETSERFPNLEKDDFFLIIQTEFQLQQYITFGNEVVCVDVTHKTTQYDLKLTSVLCVDEWGEGIPVMWAISSKEDTAMVNVIFTLLKERSPATVPEYLMSDDAPVYFSALKEVFTEGITKKLLCSWHFERTWQRAIVERIETKALQDDVYQELTVIAHSQNEQEFRELLRIFMKNLGNKKTTQEYGNYFSTEYVSRVHEWAAWARKQSLVNTNMYVESFHHVLKHGDYLQGKQNKRLDSLIDVLFKLESYYVEERVRKMEKGKVTKRIQGINARHRTSLKMKEEDYVFEKGVGEEWKFKKQNYSVIKRSCPRSVCKLACTLCKICIHAYSCSCADMLYLKTICKHIHYIHRLTERIPANSDHSESVHGVDNVLKHEHDYAGVDTDLMADSKEQQDAERRKEALAKILKSRRPEGNLKIIKDETQQLLSQLTDLLSSCDHLETLHQVKSRFQSQILPLFNIVKQSDIAGTVKTENLPPIVDTFSSNRNFDHQLRLSRSKKRKRSSLFKKSTESANTARTRLRLQQQVCSTCHLEDDGQENEQMVKWTSCNVCGAWHHQECIPVGSEESFICLTCQ